MKFNSHIKYKTKPKLLHLLLSLIITLSMIIPMFTAQTLEAYATSAGGDMGAEDSGPASGTYDGGPMSSRTGWLFYCIDLSNNQVTSTVATTSSGGIVDKNGKSLPSSNIILTSRYGVEASNLQTGCDWGPPYNENAEGLGDEVKDYYISSKHNLAETPITSSKQATFKCKKSHLKSKRL